MTERCRRAGNHQRGVQLHDLRDTVLKWANRYGQRGWLRQLGRPVIRDVEDGLLRAIARLDGTPFATTGSLAGRWLRGRLPRRSDAEQVSLETAYCAEVVAVTYQMMGLLPEEKRSNYYDPGRFWSGDHLELGGLGEEIEVAIPAAGDE